MKKLLSKRVVLHVLGAIIVIIILANSLTIVQAGHTGVVLTLGVLKESVL